MKTLTTVALLATALAASPAFAGLDGAQLMQQDRAIAAAKQERQAQSGPAAAGPAGSAQAAREGMPGAQPVKRLHPKTGL
jgi:hypothetical protein